MRSSSVRCSDTAEGASARSVRVVLMAIRVSCPLWSGARRDRRPWPCVSRRGRGLRTGRRASHSGRTVSARRDGRPRHLRWPRMRERVWWTRLRWRLRGATMWPAFLAALVFEAVLLHVLPIAGDVAPDVFAAVLLAFFFNLVAVAVGAPLVGRFVRRRWPGLPKVVADDRAGTALIAGVAGLVLALGVAHRPAMQRQEHAFGLQAAA